MLLGGGRVAQCRGYNTRGDIQGQGTCREDERAL